MRLAFPVAALPLLLVGSASAFSPSPRQGQVRFKATSSFTRLYVDPSDPYAAVLDAYQNKGAAAVTVPIDTALPVFAPDAAVSSVAEAADSVNAQAVSDAAVDAIAAAERAASAAADIAVQIGAGVAATAKGAAVAAPVAAGKALPLASFVTQGVAGLPSSLPSVPDFDAVSNAKEKFGLMFENIVGSQAARQANDLNDQVLQGVKKIGDNDAASQFASNLKEIAAGAAFGATAGSSPNMDNVNVDALVQNLNLQEYGAWYVAGASMILAVTQRNAGYKAGKVQFEAELGEAQAKANEAAEAAAMAAQGARMARDMAVKIEAKQITAAPKSGKTMIEESKIREMTLEKDMMKVELEKITSETALLRRMLNEVLSAQAEAATGSDLESAQFIAEPDVIPVVFEKMEQDPGDNTRILELIKEMDEENKKINGAKTVEMVEEIKAIEDVKVVKETKSVEEIKAVEEVKVAKEIKAVASNKTKPAAKPKRTRKVKAAKRVEKKAPTKVAEEVINIKSSNEVKVPAAAKPKAPKKKPAEKKEVPKEVVVAANGDNPWNTLSDSTLKRKTVIELTTYLTDRQIDVIDESGKVFKKVQLVEALRSL